MTRLRIREHARRSNIDDVLILPAAEFIGQLLEILIFIGHRDKVDRNLVIAQFRRMLCRILLRPSVADRAICDDVRTAAEDKHAERVIRAAAAGRERKRCTADQDSGQSDETGVPQKPSLFHNSHLFI